MLWDVWEYIAGQFRMTVKPALRNLFASKKFFISMFLAVYVLQTLLCVICIAGVNNVTEQNRILEMFSSYISNAGSSGDVEFAERVAVLLNSAGIFAGALCIWWLCALTVYFKLASASAERNKYVWGMYITYGAVRKKISRMLASELYLTLAAGMAAGFPTAYFICRLAARQGITAYAGSFWLALLIALLSVMLCIAIQTRIIASRTCSVLLVDEGSAGNITSPRRSGRLINGWTPGRYATTAFIRLRKYYIALALAAAVPVVIWVCCTTASASEAQLLNEDIAEFKINSLTGFDSELLKNEYIDELDSTKGVSGVEASAAGEAGSLGTHILLDRSQTADPGSCAQLGAVWADGEAILVSADDPAAILHTGFTTAPDGIPEGEVTILMPSDSVQYLFDDVTKQGREDVYIMIAVSRSDGKLKVITDIRQELEEQLNGDEYEYLELRLRGAFTSYPSSVSASNQYQYVDRPYFILNDKDFEKITGFGSDSLSEKIDVSNVKIDTSAYSDGSLLLEITGGIKGSLPQAGDALELQGSGVPMRGAGSASLTATAVGNYLSYDENLNSKYESIKTVSVTEHFNEMYIIDAYESGGSVFIHAAPRMSVLLHRYIRYPVMIVNYLMLGTPPLDSEYGDFSAYIASTYNNSFSVTYHDISFGKGLTLQRLTATRAVDAGTHILFEDGRLADTQKCCQLDTVYATNEFTLACADGLTPESMSLENINVGKGEAVLVLPAGINTKLSLSAGEYIRLAYVQNVTIDNQHLAIDPLYRLNELLNKVKYQYEKLALINVTESDAIKSPVILVDMTTYSALIGKEAPYSSISIIISPSLTLDEYSMLKDELKLWIDLTEDIKGTMSLTTSNSYFDVILRKAADYSVWLKVIALLVPLLIFPVWYYPQTMIFARRRSDYITLFRLGKTKRMIRRTFAWEALFASVAAVAGIIVACPVGLLLFDLVVEYFELPLEFRFSAFDFRTFLSGCICGALCAAITVWLGCLTAMKGVRKNVDT